MTTHHTPVHPRDDLAASSTRAITRTLAALKAEPDPCRRADTMGHLADLHDQTGRPQQAHLIRLVAQTERLLADPATEPPDDDAWDHDTWWTLAGTADRHARALLLEDLHDSWAVPRYGIDDSAILLLLADTDRRDTLPPATGRLPLSIPTPHPSDTTDTTDTTDAVPTEPPPAVRTVSRLRIALGAVFGGLVGLVAAHPSYAAKMFAGLGLVVMLLVWVGWLFSRGERP